MEIILADENIPLVQEAFSSFGKVNTVNGRNLTNADLTDVTTLLVRSVTKINAKLLANSSVSFVGTATIGFDHIDLDYLTENNIAFACAPGSNATAAAEYVISALLVLAERQNFQLKEKTVGIIGCGNVGSRVLKKLEALGIQCLVHDPLLQNANYVDLETILTADIITLHVPLEKDGDYPTYHLVNNDFLAELNDDVILINTSRGTVIDESALSLTLLARPNITVVLDVWKNEPNINKLLLQQVTLATPHIAGYSLDGKVRGTEMLYAKICEHFQQEKNWQPQLPPPPVTQLSFSNTIDDDVAINIAVMACYDIRKDDAVLRQMSSSFDKLRKNYPLRREFNQLTIQLPPEKSTLAKRMQGLGFKVV
ncbi:4-phosphoerythronate dehydrogenase [Candidatus Halobeggiatoa sp. HSG11]|nr:4-phosphoerythronate dehydrogenase [Candidatus Halobeggiatoa sp. HSG11]